MVGRTINIKESEQNTQRVKDTSDAGIVETGFEEPLRVFSLFAKWSACPRTCLERVFCSEI